MSLYTFSTDFLRIRFKQKDIRRSLYSGIGVRAIRQQLKQQQQHFIYKNKGYKSRFTRK